MWMKLGRIQELKWLISDRDGEIRPKSVYFEVRLPHTASLVQELRDSRIHPKVPFYAEVVKILSS